MLRLRAVSQRALSPEGCVLRELCPLRAVSPPPQSYVPGGLCPPGLCPQRAVSPQGAVLPEGFVPGRLCPPRAVSPEGSLYFWALMGLAYSSGKLENQMPSLVGCLEPSHVLIFALRELSRRH